MGRRLFICAQVIVVGLLRALILAAALAGRVELVQILRGLISIDPSMNL